MPPKHNKSGGPAAVGKSSDVTNEDGWEIPLPAVVLADAFETRFAPLSIVKPRCLLPLANTPLIEYTLEFLASAGTKEVYVYCGAHRELVEDYLIASRWSRPSSPFALHILRSTARSVGDAMRDLDKRALFQSDFLLVHGDLVCNLSLAAAVHSHRLRRKRDKNSIMTMVLRSDGPGASLCHFGREGSRRGKDGSVRNPVFVLDPKSKRCFHYERLDPVYPRRVTVDHDVLFRSGATDLETRADLIDTGIDICTPDVLALWSDNFDFKLARRNFLHNVLRDYELNGKTVHVHIENSGFAERANSWGAYSRLTERVVRRWAYPFTPDANFDGGICRLDMDFVYKENNIKMARSSKAQRWTVIGDRAIVGEQVVIKEGSIIGKAAKIGDKVILNGTFCGPYVVIGSGSVVGKAVLAAGVHIGENCDIQDGVILSYGVRIADGVSIKKGMKISTVVMEDDEEAPRPLETDERIVGLGGAGAEWIDATPDEDVELGDDDAAELIPPVYPASPLSISTLHSHSSFSSMDSGGDTPAPPLQDRASFMSLTSLENTGPSEIFGAFTEANTASTAAGFHKEAVSSLLDSLRRNHDPGNVTLELNGLRLANNAGEKQVRHALVSAFAKRIFEVIDGAVVSVDDSDSDSDSDAGNDTPTIVAKSEPKTAKEAVDAVLGPYSSVVQRTVFNQDGESDLLSCWERTCARRGAEKEGDGDVVLLQVATGLCKADVVSAEGLEQWWEGGRKDEEPWVRRKTGQLVEYLCGDDDSEEEEDDDDDESGEEDDE